MPHLETTHTTHDGQSLYLQAWEPEGDRKAAVLIVHGLGEHSSRYAHFAEKLTAHGYAVYTFDGRGHGKSETKKPTAYFPSVVDYLKDIDALYHKMKSYAKAPCFIFGHSMGGGLVARYVVDHDPEAKGILLTGAALKPGDDISPFLIKISKFLSKIFPKLKAVKLDASAISKDPEVVKLYDNDPLVYRGGIPARVGAELLNTMDVINEKVKSFQLPVLIMHGTEDRLTNVEGSKELHENISSKDKELKLYEGLFHELVNEPEKETVMQDMINWMDVRLA